MGPTGEGVGRGEDGGASPGATPQVLWGGAGSSVKDEAALGTSCPSANVRVSSS